MNSSIFRSDSSFDWLYPEHLQLISEKHWTPIKIARKAAKFLALPSSKVLDIGSGIGKFCLTGAFHYPLTSFYGVEQRHELIHFAEEARNYAQIDNANFIHANITQVNFDSFDHFYFYNSFGKILTRVIRLTIPLKLHLIYIPTIRSIYSICYIQGQQEQD